MLKSSLGSPVFIGFTAGMVLLTLSRFLLIIRSSERARTVFTSSTQYLKQYLGGAVCVDPLVLEHVRHAKLVVRREVTILIYVLLGVLLYTSLLSRFFMIWFTAH